MAFNEDRWVRVEGSPFAEHVNKVLIDPAMEKIKEEKSGVYPKIPVKRDEDGKVLLRDELLNSPAITFQGTVNSIALQFSKLIELLSKMGLG